MSKSQPDTAPAIDPERQKLTALVNRAQAGDATAMPELHDYFQKPEKIDFVGNMARRSLELMVEKMSGTNLFVRGG